MSWAIGLIWLLAAMEFVFAARSVVERRPVGAIGRFARRQDFRSSAIGYAVLGGFFACEGVYYLTYRVVWFEIAAIYISIGLVALIVVKIRRYQSDRGN